MPPKIDVTCPKCKTLYRLSERTIKEVVKQELLNTDDSSDFDAPARELLHHLLGDGGAKQLAADLRDMVRGEEHTAATKLRALEIISSLLKHHEKMVPTPIELGAMDKRELDHYLNTKLGCKGEPLPPEVKVATPDWMQKIQANASAKRRSSKLTCGDYADIINKKFQGKDWFVRAAPERDGTTEVIVCYVTEPANVPTELIVDNKTAWGGFPIQLAKTRKMDDSSRVLGGQPQSQ